MAAPTRTGGDALPTWQVVCYDPREVAGLRALMREAVEEDVPGSTHPVVTGFLDGERVALMRLPFGNDPELLRRVAESLLDQTHPALLISTGTAMALDPATEVGTVVVPTAAWYEGRVVDVDGPAVADVLEAAPADVPVVRGATITSAKFVDGPAAAEESRRLWPRASILEMEDYHLGRLARRRGIEFVSLRGVTDHGSWDDHMSAVPTVAAAVVRVLRRTIRRLRGRRMLVAADNPTTADMPWRVVVSSPGRLTIPEAVAAVRNAAARFELEGLLPQDGRLDLRLAAPGAPDAQSATPSGSARILAADDGSWTLVLDDEARYVRLMVDPEALVDPARAPGSVASRLLGLAPVTVPRGGPAEPAVELPAVSSVHVQGLNSMSAEACEGLLAATTIEEFTDSGIPVVAAQKAPCWIYRTANAADSSYFAPDYALPMRRTVRIPHGTWLVATGLGPAIDPSAAGGTEAWTLMLGDEQGGRLVQYLDDVAGRRVRPDVVFRHEGVAQRLGSDTVVLSRLDRRPFLSVAGLNGLSFAPKTVRRIYSGAYDAFLRSYFPRRRRREARVSYLFTTSRGCGNRCSICCCGGHQPFTALSVDVLVEALHAIKRLYSLRQGDHVAIYFLDSNFNKDPGRILRLADRVEAEGLRPWFEFYVRHNSLQPFLPHATGQRDRRRVNRELVHAYHRLGIDEVVLGVDAFTDLSITLLKGDWELLASRGADAAPPYTAEDVEACLEAIEREGLSSRCFLLRHDPFVDDADRIETWYRLAVLATKLPGFRLDTESADSVNELKPFPGSPLATVAARVPGLVVNGRFRSPSELGEVEAELDIGVFHALRRTPRARTAFLKSLQGSRKRLGKFLQERLARPEMLSPAGRTELAGAVAAYLTGEERLAPLVATAAGRRSAVGRAEGELATAAAGMRKSADRLDAEPRSSVPPRARRFLDLLAELRR